MMIRIVPIVFPSIWKHPRPPLSRLTPKPEPTRNDTRARVSMINQSGSPYLFRRTSILLLHHAQERAASIQQMEMDLDPLGRSDLDSLGGDLDQRHDIALAGNATCWLCVR